MLNLDIHYRFHSSKLLFLDQTLLYLCKYGGSKLVSMGSEKWLDTEIWNSPAECFSLDLKNKEIQVFKGCFLTQATQAYLADHPSEKAWDALVICCFHGHGGVTKDSGESDCDI